MPEISLPEVKINLPDVTMPEFHRSDVHLPDFNWSGLKKLDLKAPDVHLPEFSMPKVDMPRVDMPKVDMKNVEFPRSLASLRRFGRPEPRRRSLLPWAIVAASAAVFAGWWLATSTVTGPRVRRLATRARERIEDLRNGRAYGEGEEQEAAATGWASEPSWHSTAESGPARDTSSSDT